MTLSVVQLFGFIESLVLDEKINNLILVTYTIIIKDPLYLMEYFLRIYGLYETRFL